MWLGTEKNLLGLCLALLVAIYLGYPGTGNRLLTTAGSRPQITRGIGVAKCFLPIGHVHPGSWSLIYARCRKLICGLIRVTY